MLHERLRGGGDQEHEGVHQENIGKSVCFVFHCTVDFTSDGTPVAVAAGNLWFVCFIGCNINVANRTNHKFPAATPTGVPSEVKSTVVHAYG